MKSVWSMFVLLGAVGFTGCAVSPEEPSQPSEESASVSQPQKKWGGTAGECSVVRCHAEGEPGIREPGTFACWFGVCVCIGASSGKTGECNGGNVCGEASCPQGETSSEAALWQKVPLYRDALTK